MHHIAFHRLKSHTLFPCPASQLIYIFLKFQCVLCILHISVANTVIRKESYFRINVSWDIINVQRRQQGTKDSALWDPIRVCFVNNNSLLSVAQKRIYPFQCLPPMPQPNTLPLRSSCGGVSNAFSKSKMNVSTCPPLSKILAQSFITVVNWVSQLCLFLNACCYLRKDYIHPDEPGSSSTLCVRVTCKVHKSVRWDDVYMRESSHPFYRGDIYLQETILWGFHPRRLEEMGKNWTQFSFQAPLGLMDEVHQTETSRKLSTTHTRW